MLRSPLVFRLGWRSFFCKKSQPGFPEARGGAYRAQLPLNPGQVPPSLPPFFSLSWGYWESLRLAQVACPDAHTPAPTDDVVDSVPWASLTSPKRDFGDGGGSSGRGAPISKPIQCYRHCREWGGERPEPVAPPHPPSGGAHANVHMEGMCANEVDE
jgi:hypothetical protein